VGVKVREVGLMLVGQMEGGTWGCWWRHLDPDSSSPADTAKTREEIEEKAKDLTRDRRIQAWINRG